MTDGYTPALYADLANLDTTGAPEPTIGLRTDGQRLLYPEAVNVLFGEPESGKTLAASAITADALFDGHSVLWVDVDHNGPHATRQRFLDYGVHREIITDPNRFRYTSPEEGNTVLEVIQEAYVWRPGLVVVDSIGEVLPMFEANSNDADDYTRVHRMTLSALANTGACVLAIDHQAKGKDSSDYGSTGTAAKKRAVNGAMLRVRCTQTFSPGRGGRADLTIVKDRHGALRATVPSDREPVIASFQLIGGDATDWKFWPPHDGNDSAPRNVAQDAAELDALDPPPSSTRDVQARMKWSPRRASPALKHWRATRYPEAQGNGNQHLLPASHPYRGEAEEATEPNSRKAQP